MTITMTRGRYRARWAETEAQRRAAFRLRHRCFIETPGLAPRPGGLDRDAFDETHRQLLILQEGDDMPVACCRVAAFSGGAAARSSYSATYYDLAPLAQQRGHSAEVGRFCVDPAAQADPDVLRTAWGALTGFVDENDVDFLFGCSSFAGTDPGPHDAALRLLGQAYCAPAALAPRRRAAEVLPLRHSGPLGPTALRQGHAALPPLLRGYLRMGGWVGDHLVVDRDLQTLHIFTGLEIRNVPRARAQSLRRLAAAGD